MKGLFESYTDVREPLLFCLSHRTRSQTNFKLSALEESQNKTSEGYLIGLICINDRVPSCTNIECRNQNIVLREMIKNTIN